MDYCKVQSCCQKVRPSPTQSPPPTNHTNETDERKIEEIKEYVEGLRIRPTIYETKNTTHSRLMLTIFFSPNLTHIHSW